MKDMPVFLLYLLRNQYYNKMKKKSVLSLFFAGIFLIACSGHASKQKNKDPEPIQTEKQKADAPNLKDSLKIKDGLGDIVELRRNTPGSKRTGYKIRPNYLFSRK